MMGTSNAEANGMSNPGLVSIISRIDRLCCSSRTKNGLRVDPSMLRKIRRTYWSIAIGFPLEGKPWGLATVVLGDIDDAIALRESRPLRSLAAWWPCFQKALRKIQNRVWLSALLG